MTDKNTGWRERFNTFVRRCHSTLGPFKSHYASFIEKEIKQARREGAIEALERIKNDRKRHNGCGDEIIYCIGKDIK